MLRTRILISALAIACFFLSATSALAVGKAPSRKAAAASTLEGQIVSQMNTIRARRGLPRLRMSKRLAAAADLHSRNMARLGFFAHESADGSAFWNRVKRYYGWSGYSSWMVGENLLWSSPTIDAPGAVTMWMESPGHRANILNREWREVGLSAIFVPAAPGTFGGNDVTIVTADFGYRR